MTIDGALSRMSLTKRMAVAERADVAAELGQIGSGEDAGRRPDDASRARQDDAADDGVEQAALRPGRGVISSEEGGADRREPVG